MSIAVYTCFDYTKSLVDDVLRNAAGHSVQTQFRLIRVCEDGANLERARRLLEESRRSA